MNLDIGYEKRGVEIIACALRNVPKQSSFNELASFAHNLAGGISSPWPIGRHGIEIEHCCTVSTASFPERPQDIPAHHLPRGHTTTPMHPTGQPRPCSHSEPSQMWCQNIAHKGMLRLAFHDDGQVTHVWVPRPRHSSARVHPRSTPPTTLSKKKGPIS